MKGINLRAGELDPRAEAGNLQSEPEVFCGTRNEGSAQKT